MIRRKVQDLPGIVITAAMGFLLLTAAGDYNACEFAQNNTYFLRAQTKKALTAKSFNLAKYHAYKALNGMYKSQPNFVDCGCERALTTVSNAGKNLKEATRAKSFEDAEVFLNIALQNIGLTLNALESLNHRYTGDYRDDILVMNIKDVEGTSKKLGIGPANQLQSTMEKGLTRFKNSLEQVVALAEFEEAKRFIHELLEKTQQELKITTLTTAQRQYHSKVQDLAYDALSKLSDCPR